MPTLKINMDKLRSFALLVSLASACVGLSSVPTLAAETVSLEGKWFGVSICRGNIAEVYLEISQDNQGYSGTTTVPGYNGTTEISITSFDGTDFLVKARRIGQRQGSMEQLFETEAIMRLQSTNRRCTDQVLTKQLPINELKGLPVCGGTEYEKTLWPKLGKQVYSKTHYYPASPLPVPGFNRKNAVLRTLYTGEHSKKYFGKELTKVSSDVFRRVENQLLTCALLSKDKYRLPQAIVDTERMIALRWKLLKGENGIAKPQFSREYAAFRMKHTDLQPFNHGPSVLSGWQELVGEPNLKKNLENFVLERSESFVNADPLIELPVYKELYRQYMIVKNNPDWKPASHYISPELEATLAAADNGNREALVWVFSALKILVQEEATRYDVGLYTSFYEGEKEGAYNLRLSGLVTRLTDVLTSHSPDLSVALMSHFLKGLESKNGNYIHFTTVSKIYRKSGLEGRLDSEVSQLAALIKARAFLVTAQSKRGYKRVIDEVQPLMTSTFPEIQKAAKEVHSMARAGFRTAAPAKDSPEYFGYALQNALVQSWFTPVQPGVKLPHETLADDLTLDLLLK